jgi:hypothetical protein
MKLNGVYSNLGGSRRSMYHYKYHMHPKKKRRVALPFILYVFMKMADRQGFEPWIPSLVYSLSRGALSTTQPPVLMGVSAGDARFRTYPAVFVKR